MFDLPDRNASLNACEAEMRRCLGHGRIADLARAHLDSGGSRARACLAIATGDRLDLAPDTTSAIAACAELLHNASLVHDDIQDGDRTRRGRDAIWHAEGPAAAICVGDLMISAAFGTLAALPSAAAPGALATVHHTVATTIRGQAEDLAAPSTAPFDQTLAIAAEKSAPLIALPVRLCLKAAGIDADHAARQAGAAIAAAYQIADDLGDRAADRAADRPNACLALEHGGLSPDAARSAAREHAAAALAEAKLAARGIPGHGGAGLADLADTVAAKLEEAGNAP